MSTRIKYLVLCYLLATGLSSAQNHFVFEKSKPIVNAGFGFACDTVGRLYASNRTHQIDVLDQSLNSLFSFGSYGTANGQFRTPGDIAIGADLCIYVSDMDNRRIQQFDKSGSFIREFGDQYLDAPRGIVLDKMNNVWVVDRGKRMVFVFDKDGIFLKVLNTSVPLVDPVGICIDRLGNLLVADVGNGIVGNGIKIFDQNGTNVKTIGVRSSGHIKCSRSGEIFIIGTSDMVLVLDEEGNTKDDVSLSNPVAFGINANGTSLFVSEYTNNRIVSYSRKIKQKVSFDPVPDKIFGDPDFTLSGMSDSGLPVKFKSSDAQILLIEGNVAYIKGVGHVTIKALQSGNDSFIADSVLHSIEISKAAQTVTIESIVDKTYGDADFTVTATSNSGLPLLLTSSDDTILSIENNKASILGVGTVVIKAIQNGNAFFKADTATQVLFVNKSPQILTLETITDKEYGMNDFKVGVTSSQDLPVTITSSDTSVVSITGAIAKIKNAGKATILASQAGTDFVASASTYQNVTVNKALQTLRFDSIPEVDFSTRSIPLTASASSGLPVRFTSSDQTVALIIGDVAIINSLGEATIKAVQSGDRNHFPAGEISRKLVISNITGAEGSNSSPISVYPNPVNNFLIIEGFEEGQASCELLSLSGTILLMQTLGNKSNRIDLRELPSAVYFLRIIQADKIEFRKIVKY